MGFNAISEIRELRASVGLPPLELGRFNWHVRLLQRALNDHGANLKIDGVYGVRTEMAVEEFQKTNNLQVDGKVGPQTWNALSHHPDKPITPIVPALSPEAFALKITMMDRRERISAIANAILSMDVREKGNNRGEVVDAFNLHANGLVGQPWCIAFCDFVVDNAYLGTGRRPPYDVGVSSSGLLRRAKKHGLVRDPMTARRGDLFIVPGGPTGWQHGGIVDGVERSRIITIEGNTDKSGTNEGQGVYSIKRDVIGQGLAIVSVTD